MPAARMSNVGVIIGSNLSQASIVRGSFGQDVEREYLEGREMKLMCLLRMKHKRVATCVVFPRAQSRIHLIGSRRQFERILQLDANHLLFVARVAEHEKAFARRP